MSADVNSQLKKKRGVLRETSPLLDGLSQMGYENWLKEQKEKASRGFDNIHFLEEKKR